MGFWSNILGALAAPGASGGSAYYTPRVTYMGATELAATMDPSRLTVAQMWSSQPHFRTVVTFLARNIAQLGLHTFERVDDTDRKRDRSSVLARSLADVDGNMTTFELIFALVGDLALYDRAYWWVAPSSEMPSGWMIRRLPPTWVEPVMANAWQVKEYRAFIKPNGGYEVIKPEFILAFPGYAPTKMHGASPTVDALRQTLQEQVEAALYRSQVWKRGGRVSSVLSRPKDAPAWSDEARNKFREDWYAKFTGRGVGAGGTPILEDGMTLQRIDFNAQEQQFVEAAKLSLVTVASAFHVNPTMIGQNDGANYSNVREFRKMLYGDTLGPLIAQIEGRINTFLVPRMGLDNAHTYVEFNIEEKLQGNFEEQTAALSTAIGGPWMTTNEGRALRNLPAIEGGDSIITQLNTVRGGGDQASPRDSGSQNRNAGRASVKAAPDDDLEDDAEATIRAFLARQGRVVLSRLGAGREWWDADRWDAELTDALLSLYLLGATAAGRATLEGLGLDPDDYDEPRTRAYLEEVAASTAGGVNETTRKRVQAALDESDDPTEAAGSVFADVSRAAVLATAVATLAASWGSEEAARQRAPRATKTWRTTSGNSRSSHARMNGETVPVGERFSNGMRYPGDDTDMDETAGCRCVITIHRPES